MAFPRPQALQAPAPARAGVSPGDRRRLAPGGSWSVRGALAGALLGLLPGCHILGVGGGVPCSDNDHCPPTSTCVGGTCSLPDPPVGVGDGDGDTTGGDGDGDGDVLLKPTRCADVLQGDPQASTGTYTIYPPGRLDGVEVWCEMDVAGGGWTLAGRSEGDADWNDPFGWFVERGQPDDHQAVYAAGIGNFGIEVTELLVGEYQSETELGRNVYRIELPSNLFDDQWRNTPLERSDLEIVETTCEGDIDLELQQPWMLIHFGCTDSSFFYMRDGNSCENFGLFPDGFSIAYDNCEQAGGLGWRERGVIFIR